MSKAITFKTRSGEKIYTSPYMPVGSIYFSINNINPTVYFGGTWEQIKDKFLLCCGSTYSAGSSGGSSTVTLTKNQIPSHNHTGNTDGAGFHEHQVALNGDPSFNIFYRLTWGATNTGYCISGNNINGQSSGASFPSIAKGNGNHAHSFTTSSVGNSAAHDNMPPYLAVYVWKRVS